MVTKPKSASLLRILAFVLVLLPSKIYADGYVHDGGLWGTIKEPIRDAAKEKYEGLSDKGRFCVGLGVGFGCTKIAIRTTVKTVKTVGAAYIAFEALEYAGLLKEARTGKENRVLIEKSRDYVLRTVDGIRADMRETLSPAKIKSRFEKAMEKDKAGATGLGAGVFMGCLL